MLRGARDVPQHFPTCTGPAACSISGYSCPLTGGSACSTGSSPACSRNVACTQSTVTVPPVLQDLTYEYDENGNIEKVSDKVNYLVHNYAYDDLNRLKQAVGTGTGAYTQSYDYDILGNIIYKSDVGTYAYSYGDKPHALRSAGSMTFAYDANGNMTTRQGVSITWNADNKPVSVGSTTFAYDGVGNRVKKTSTSGTTYYFGEAYEIRGSVGVIHLFANGQRIATIRDDGRSFTTHGNHLGSASVVTDQNGEAKEKMEYFPFGAYRANASPNDQYGTKDFDGTFPNANYTFTGQELDETGLYDYHARQYDPVTGRFISPDSVIQSPGDLQTFNRYSYVRNNPLVYTDPSGHWLDIVFGAVMGGVSAGYETNWDFDAVLVGCVAGALSSWAGGYVGGYMGSVVYSATESQFVGAVAGVAVGGAVGGAVSGGIWAGAYGNDIGGAMATGAINGAVSALVQYGAGLGAGLGMGQIEEWMEESSDVALAATDGDKYCTGKARIMRSNDNIINKSDHLGGISYEPVQVGEAAIIPRQFGFETDKGYLMHSYGDKMSAIDLETGKTLFTKATDVVGPRSVRDTYVGRNLPLLEIYGHPDLGVRDVLISVPAGVQCPSTMMTLFPYIYP